MLKWDGKNGICLWEIATYTRTQHLFTHKKITEYKWKLLSKRGWGKKIYYDILAFMGKVFLYFHLWLSVFFADVDYVCSDFQPESRWSFFHTSKILIRDDFQPLKFPLQLWSTISQILILPRTHSKRTRIRWRRRRKRNCRIINESLWSNEIFFDDST